MLMAGYGGKWVKARFFFDRGRGGLARLKGEEAENQKPPQSRGFSRFSFSREGGGRSGEREKGSWLLWLL